MMVWHAFILNPRNFLADCIRFGKMKLWALGLPWALVARAIDDETFQYNPGRFTVDTFKSRTRRPWNNLDEPEPSLPPVLLLRTGPQPTKASVVMV